MHSIPIDLASEFSAHLKSLRKARKLTQTQLGALIGIKQTRMADIEKNPGIVSVGQLLEVLHALDARLLIAVPTAEEASGAPPSVMPTLSTLGAADW